MLDILESTRFNELHAATMDHLAKQDKLQNYGALTMFGAMAINSAAILVEQRLDMPAADQLPVYGYFGAVALSLPFAAAMAKNWLSMRGIRKEIVEAEQQALSGSPA